MTNAPHDKRTLRPWIKAALAAVSEPEWRAWCGPLQERLLAHEGIRASASVLAFVGLPAWREVDTERVCLALLGEGKRLALPRTERAALVRGEGASAAGAVIASWVSDWDRDVVVDPASSFGGTMRGPRVGLPEARPEDVDLVIVPGLAFDERGGRLGRGAGFYDRVLGALRPSAWRIAVAFECQIVERVPMDEHDQRVHAIVTERRVIEVSRPG